MAAPCNLSSGRELDFVAESLSVVMNDYPVCLWIIQNIEEQCIKKFFFVKIKDAVSIVQRMWVLESGNSVTF